MAKHKLDAKRADGHTVTYVLVAKNRQTAKDILNRRWRGRYQPEEGDALLSDKEIEKKVDAWVKETYGEFV